MNLFVEDVIPEDWEGEIRESTIKGKPDWRRLLEELPCGDGFVEVGHESDGATVMFMRSIPFFGFPKHKHPIATRRHDKRCEEAAKYKKTDKARYKKLRKIADQMFKADVGMGGTKFEQLKGYFGVRVGAFF